MPRSKFVPKAHILDLLSIINPTSNIAVYVQLENLIHFGIVSGKLVTGDQLPPARDLADRLGINMNTVSKAYRDLVVLGLLGTKRGQGVFIKDDVLEKCRFFVQEIVVQHIFEAAAEAKLAGYDKELLKEMIDKIYAQQVYPYGSIPRDIFPKA
ncbi:MAG: GntR family transcriptional regulator [Candidatus Hydrogenedentes bacterium]|jgi:GntR family transcriptional regulator|nr:GntR family transcriptional regulator [Candidatus Hydrogenedentota bacterium]